MNSFLRKKVFVRPLSYAEAYLVLEALLFFTIVIGWLHDIKLGLKNINQYPNVLTMVISKFPVVNTSYYNHTQVEAINLTRYAMKNAFVSAPILAVWLAIFIFGTRIGNIEKRKGYPEKSGARFLFYFSLSMLLLPLLMYTILHI